MQRATSIALATLVAAGSVAAFADQPMPAIPPTPGPVLELVSAQPIVLQQPYQFEWSADRPQVTAGYLLVLSVNPDYVYARQTAEPILYVGNGTAERLNNGYESGRVIAFAPSSLNEDGSLSLDLKASPIWFGTPGLPERVDAATAADEAALARRVGIKPFTEAQVDQARARGGAGVTVADKTALLGEAAKAILTYSPQEKDLARDYLRINGKALAD